jgi:hypothetical protein
MAVYCDGFASHGKVETLELDAGKRNFLQVRGWVVLTYLLGTDHLAGRRRMRSADRAGLPGPEVLLSLAKHGDARPAKSRHWVDFQLLSILTTDHLPSVISRTSRT